MKNTPKNEKKSREGPKTNNICSESLALQYEVDYLAFGSFYTRLWVAEFDLLNCCLDDFSTLLVKAYIFQQHYFFGSSIKSACLV